MECRPFRFKQRRTRILGRKPNPSTLYDGELYLNTCDGKAFFKNSACDGLFTIITDADGNGLEKIKFSGASEGDVGVWDGYKFIPTSLSNNLSGDTGYFEQSGDSQYLTSFARATTIDNNWTNLEINSSDKLYELKNSEEIFFIITLTAAGSNKTASFKIEGSASRGSIIEEGGFDYSSSKLLSSATNIFQKTNKTYDAQVFVDVSNGSLKLKCLGDLDVEMRWYAKIEIIKLNIINIIIQKSLASGLFFPDGTSQTLIDAILAQLANPNAAVNIVLSSYEDVQ